MVMMRERQDGMEEETDDIYVQEFDLPGPQSSLLREPVWVAHLASPSIGGARKADRHQSSGDDDHHKPRGKLLKPEDHSVPGSRVPGDEIHGQ